MLLKKISAKLMLLNDRIWKLFVLWPNYKLLKDLLLIGRPQIVIGKDAVFTYSNPVIMVSDSWRATLGRANRCKLVVYDNASLNLGQKVAMSNTTIISTKSIKIGNNVMIGGGCTIVDSDFHSLSPNHWWTNNDVKNMLSKPVVIGDNVFIGMDSLVIKGVTIGNNSIIAARSVVTTQIPENEVWGG